MTHRRGGTFRRAAPSLKSWQSTNDGIKNFPLSGSIALGVAGTTGTPISFIGSVTVDDFTVLRTRGMWSAGADLTTAGDAIQVSVGLGIIPNVVGQAAFPSPIVDADWDGWFLHETIMLLAGGTSASLEQDSRVVDTKAMRKVHGGDSVLASFDAANINGTTATVGFEFWARFLLKLS